MEPVIKPYVHLTIDAVDVVVFDPENRFDPENYDRYATYPQARDAALSSIELMLDQADYDGDDHREELERMLRLLEPSESFDDLRDAPDYLWFLARLAPAAHAA